jgi:hypothetical protein
MERERRKGGGRKEEEGEEEEGGEEKFSLSAQVADDISFERYN